MRLSKYILSASHSYYSSSEAATHLYSTSWQQSNYFSILETFRPLESWE